ncbi:MAG: bifunctional 4-hydroxy-2-oxoglutarate aldolase/2-dehydro-3-deoxy-phosphogluconate aldolase [Arenicella sp.]
MITAKQASEFILNDLTGVSVIPVLVVDDYTLAADLAKILVDAGLPILEVTLRTPNALRVIEEMAKVDGAIVAAGTVLNESHVQDAKSAGARFLVSPGYTASLFSTASQADMPLLPGVATASEVMSAADVGFSLVKFFPAQINGGVPALKALGGPLPEMRFCPTGGVNMTNMNEYLALKNVACVGGSWMVTDEDLLTRNWRNIADKANALKR